MNPVIRQPEQVRIGEYGDSGKWKGQRSSHMYILLYLEWEGVVVSTLETNTNKLNIFTLSGFHRKVKLL